MWAADNNNSACFVMYVRRKSKFSNHACFEHHDYGRSNLMWAAANVVTMHAAYIFGVVSRLKLLLCG